MIKIVYDEIYYDFQINTTESVIIGRNRQEVLEKVQRGFENQYNKYGKLKREDIKTLDYKTLQAWKRLQNHILLYIYLKGIGNYFNHLFSTLYYFCKK